MALLNLTAAARAIGVNRSTIARALKSGRLSATTNEAGERCIDTVELLRVFGSLQADAQADAQPLPMRAMGTDALVDVLQEQLRCANERERQGREREARLLSLLESEQQARRALEVKLLPSPSPRHTQLAILIAVLALALLALAIARLAG
jgi:hypothetical protein